MTIYSLDNKPIDLSFADNVRDNTFQETKNIENGRLKVPLFFIDNLFSIPSDYVPTTLAVPSALRSPGRHVFKQGGDSVYVKNKTIYISNKYLKDNDLLHNKKETITPFNSLPVSPARSTKDEGIPTWKKVAYGISAIATAALIAYGGYHSISYMLTPEYSDIPTLDISKIPLDGYKRSCDFISQTSQYSKSKILQSIRAEMNKDEPRMDLLQSCTNNGWASKPTSEKEGCNPRSTTGEYHYHVFEPCTRRSYGRSHSSVSFSKRNPQTLIYETGNHYDSPTCLPRFVAVNCDLSDNNLINCEGKTKEGESYKKVLEFSFQETFKSNNRSSITEHIVSNSDEVKRTYLLEEGKPPWFLNSLLNEKIFYQSEADGSCKRLPIHFRNSLK